MLKVDKLFSKSGIHAISFAIDWIQRRVREGGPGGEEKENAFGPPVVFERSSTQPEIRRPEFFLFESAVTH
jgi:hypothetical protein